MKIILLTIYIFVCFFYMFKSISVTETRRQLIDAMFVYDLLDTTRMVNETGIVKDNTELRSMMRNVLEPSILAFFHPLKYWNPEEYVRNDIYVKIRPYLEFTKKHSFEKIQGIKRDEKDNIYFEFVFSTGIGRHCVIDSRELQN